MFSDAEQRFEDAKRELFEALSHEVAQMFSQHLDDVGLGYHENFVVTEGEGQLQIACEDDGVDERVNVELARFVDDPKVDKWASLWDKKPAVLSAERELSDEERVAQEFARASHLDDVTLRFVGCLQAVWDQIPHQVQFHELERLRGETVVLLQQGRTLETAEVFIDHVREWFSGEFQEYEPFWTEMLSILVNLEESYESDAEKVLTVYETALEQGLEHDEIVSVVWDALPAALSPAALPDNFGGFLNLRRIDGIMPLLEDMVDVGLHETKTSSYDYHPDLDVRRERHETLQETEVLRREFLSEVNRRLRARKNEGLSSFAQNVSQLGM